MGLNQSCPASEYVHGDDDLPVCFDSNDDNWEENFLAELGQPSTIEEEEEDDHDEEPVSTLHSFSEAMKSLDNVKLFLESRGCVQEAITIGSGMDRVASAMNEHNSTSVHVHVPISKKVILNT
jgi:hypothetical protein